MTLYEIDKSIEALVNAVDPDTGEITVDNDALDALLMERDTKVENIACCIKNLSAAQRHSKKRNRLFPPAARQPRRKSND